MKGLSKNEIEVISTLEFDKKYFFTREDIKYFFKDDQQMSDFIFGLKKKKRILKINRSKYYLIPLRAYEGSWSENSLIVADEICDGKDYMIGGWAAARYWRFTDQIPMQVDIYTTRRQGKYFIMNMRYIFHRTTKQNMQKAVVQEVEGHKFIVQEKDEVKKWFKHKG